MSRQVKTHCVISTAASPTGVSDWHVGGRRYSDKFKLFRYLQDSTYSSMKSRTYTRQTTLEGIVNG